MRRLILAVPSLVLLVACQPATIELTVERQAAITEELTQALDDYAAAVRDLDQERLLSFFEQSDDVTLVERGSMIRSWSALADIVRQTWPMYASVEKFEWSDIHIQALAPNVAAANMNFELAAADTTGARVAFSGTFSTVWVETNGEWKIVNLAETFPAPEKAET